MQYFRKHLSEMVLDLILVNRPNVISELGDLSDLINDVK